jgi:pyruvate dehydrogenase E2 component (dihydrolipoamide acetyltransferase)
VAEFRMPALGADMDEGTVLEWLVKPGDAVRKGDVIAVIDTEKSAIEVESFVTGTVEKLLTSVGQTVPVGTVLATIAEPAAQPTAPVPERTPVPAPERTAPEQPPAPARHERGKKSTAGRPGHPAVTISPLIRKRAHELGVDLAKLRGSGRGGAVTRADMERAAAELLKTAPTPPATAQPPTEAEPGTRAGPPARAERRVRATPRARRVAADLGVDLAGVIGTGSGGSVTEADVRRAVPAREAVPAPEAGQPPAAAREVGQLPAAAAARSAAERALSMRQAIGRLMARSKREIPHYYVSNTVDMTRSVGWLHERNRESEVTERLVPAALLLKAAALAARTVPDVNGYWLDDQFSPADAVHLGLVISLRSGGLLTPAIHDAADLPLAELMSRMRDLVIRARAGRLRGSELTDATITVTNLGDQGVESVFGVIYPPQVALVGFGKITERPFAVGGLIGARPVVVTTLAADHRASDGYTGARYLVAIADLLQRPEEL